MIEIWRFVCFRLYANLSLLTFSRKSDVLGDVDYAAIFRLFCGHLCHVLHVDLGYVKCKKFLA